MSAPDPTAGLHPIMADAVRGFFAPPPTPIQQASMRLANTEVQLERVTRDRDAYKRIVERLLDVEVVTSRETSGPFVEVETCPPDIAEAALLALIDKRRDEYEADCAERYDAWRRQEARG